MSAVGYADCYMEHISIYADNVDAYLRKNTYATTGLNYSVVLYCTA